MLNAEDATISIGHHWILHHKDLIIIDKRNETDLYVIISFFPANICMVSSILSRVLLILIINESSEVFIFSLPQGD